MKNKKASQNSSQQEPPEDDEDKDDISVTERRNQEEPTSKKTKRLSSTTSTPRELRRQRRDQLRSKSTGYLGQQTIAISVEKQQRDTNKIIFDDEEEMKSETFKAKSTKEQLQALADRKPAQEDDDDDDAVEEIKMVEAHEQEKIQQSRERDTARVAAAVQPKQRKRKRKKERTTNLEDADADADDDDFDDDFFAKVDAEMKDERKKRKESTIVQPQGRHTTFVVAATEDAATQQEVKPVQAEHNIQVVVLPEGASKATAHSVASDLNSTFVSEQTLIYSRSQLLHGSNNDDVTSPRQKKAKKSANKPTGWKRSKKMNRLLVPGVKARRRRGHGTAAPHFVVGDK